MLPAEERGQFVWDGDTTYKVFGAGTKAFWGRLKQTLALPAGSQEIILALAMILVLIFRPAGLMAGRELMLPARWVARPDATDTEPTQPTGETP